MSCRFKVKENIKEKIELMTSEAFSLPLAEANRLAHGVNKAFATNVVGFTQKAEGLQRHISIPDSLVDIYHKNEIRIEKEYPAPLPLRERISPVEASRKLLTALNFSTELDADRYLQASTSDKRKPGEILLSAVDIMQKFVAIAKGKEEQELPKQAAYIIYEMLGRKNKLSKDLWFNIEKWSKFQEMYDKYKFDNTDSQVDDFVDILPDDVERLQEDLNKNPFAKKMAIVKFIEESLVAYNELGMTPKTKRLSEDVTKEYFEKRGYKKSFEQNFLTDLFHDIWNWINEYIFRNEKFEKYDEEKLHDLVLDIVDDVYKGDYVKFLRGITKKDGKLYMPDGTELVLKDYEESMNADPVAKEIVNTVLKKIYVSKNPEATPKLSGSAVTRKYGKTYRPLTESFHDIDFVIPLSITQEEGNYMEILRLLNLNQDNYSNEFVVKKLLPLIKQQSWYKNFIIKYPNFKLTAAFIGKDHTKGESITVSGILNGEYKRGKHVKGTGYVIDFFVRTKEGTYPEEFDSYWKTWKGVFEAKFKMGRAKDLMDFIYFEPFIEDKFKFNKSGYRYFSFVDKTDADNLLDLNNLNLTPEVINLLYQDRVDKSKSLMQYGITAKSMALTLQGSSLSNEEILQKIKCI